MTPARSREFSDGLLELIEATVAPGDKIATLTSKRPNRITAVERHGITVETTRSDDRGSGPQLVPAWMVIVAWEHFERTRQLAQSALLEGPNVKRSAFVCALLARFPKVVVRSTRPTVGNR